MCVSAKKGEPSTNMLCLGSIEVGDFCMLAFIINSLIRHCSSRGEKCVFNKSREFRFHVYASFMKITMKEF